MHPHGMNRMVAQCQIAVDLVGQLRIQLSVQMPFMYAHMMSLLVYLNNILVAITCGLSLGTSLGALSSTGKTPIEAKVAAAQTIFLSLVTLVVEPMLYQAFLQIGTNFCYPFGLSQENIPVHHMISDLKTNIDHMNDLVRAKDDAKIP